MGATKSNGQRWFTVEVKGGSGLETDPRRINPQERGGKKRYKELSQHNYQLKNTVRNRGKRKSGVSKPLKHMRKAFPGGREC